MTSRPVFPSLYDENTASFLFVATFFKDSPKFNVQSPKSKTNEQTLDIGHWTFDRQMDIGRWTFDKPTTRRDALWQVERAARRPGPLLETIPESEDSGAEAPALAPLEMSRLLVRPPLAGHSRTSGHLGYACTIRP